MLIAWALLLLELRPAVAFSTAPRVPHCAAAPLRLARSAAPPALAADDDDDDKVAAALATIKDAGIAGVASYFTVEVSFFAIALPIGYVVYHGTTGEWLQLQDLLSDGEGRVRLVGIILSYIVLLKTLFPLRLGATLGQEAPRDDVPIRRRRQAFPWKFFGGEPMGGSDVFPNA